MTVRVDVLRSRVVRDILIACCDGLKGFPEAIEAVFPNTVVQTCIVHMIRNSARFVSYKDRKELVRDLKPVYAAANREGAENALAAFEEKWGRRYPMIGASWLTNWERVVPFLDFPPDIRRIIYTTNAIESLNSSLRKLVYHRGHFPSDEAAGAQSGNDESDNDIDEVHEERLELSRVAPPEPKAHRKLQDDASTRNLVHENARRTVNETEGPPRSVGVGHDESVDHASRDGAVEQGGGGVRTATAAALARAVVVALATGDMDGAVAAADALRAFVLALGRPPGRVSDGSVRAPYVRGIATVGSPGEPVRHGLPEREASPSKNFGMQLAEHACLLPRRVPEGAIRELRSRVALGRGLRRLVQRRAPPQRHPVRHAERPACPQGPSDPPRNATACTPTRNAARPVGGRDTPGTGPRSAPCT